MSRSACQRAQERSRARTAVIVAYAAIRRRVQLGRHRRETASSITAGLMKCTSGRHSAVSRLVLKRVARGLRHARRRNCAWGNVRRDEDKMFKLLQRRAPSAAGWMHTDSKQLLIESIRARVLCLTSQRYASGKCPVGSLPCHLRAYQVFGYGIGFTEAGARLRFRRWASEWRALADGTADFGAVSRRFSIHR